MDRIPITAAGAQKLKQELDHLRKVDRPEVVRLLRKPVPRETFQRMLSTMLPARSRASSKAVSPCSKAAFPRFR